MPQEVVYTYMPPNVKGFMEKDSEAEQKEGGEWWSHGTTWQGWGERVEEHKK